MSKYYNKELSNEIHAVYGGRQSGKSYYEFKKLEQRIEELEKENKTLKELNVCVGCNNNPDYKSRIDKAIEYIVTNREPVDEKDGKVLFWLSDEFDEEDLLNILKGEE